MDENKLPEIGDTYSTEITINGIKIGVKFMFNGVEWVEIED